MARGSYFDASNAAELTAALGKAAAEPLRKRQVSGLETGVLKMKAVGLTRILGADGKQVGALNEVQSEAKLAPGVYTVAFGKQRWQGVQIQSRETTELKPGYLEISALGDLFVDIAEPETEERVDQLFWNHAKTMLLPGQYQVKFGNLSWPTPVEVKPGETTHLKAGRLNIENKLGAMYVIVRDRQGQEVLETSSFRIALPPGSYMLEIDSKKFFKSLTDEQRRIPIDIAAGEEVSVPVR
jgi:hypothetical protein